MKTKAKKARISQVDDSHFEVSVPELPQKGKANAAVLKLLAKHLHLPISSFTITSGSTSSYKIVRVS